MQGYLGNAEASGKAIDARGWLRTGDIGYTENGKLYIVDRKKVVASIYAYSEETADQVRSRN